MSATNTPVRVSLLFNIFEGIPLNPYFFSFQVVLPLGATTRTLPLINFSRGVYGTALAIRLLYLSLPCAPGR